VSNRGLGEAPSTLFTQRSFVCPRPKGQAVFAAFLDRLTPIASLGNGSAPARDPADSGKRMVPVGRAGTASGGRYPASASLGGQLHLNDRAKRGVGRTSQLLPGANYLARFRSWRLSASPRTPEPTLRGGILAPFRGAKGVVHRAPFLPEQISDDTTIDLKPRDVNPMLAAHGRSGAWLAARANPAALLVQADVSGPYCTVKPSSLTDYESFRTPTRGVAAENLVARHLIRCRSAKVFGPISERRHHDLFGQES
jgi:hypothetical protein